MQLDLPSENTDLVTFVFYCFIVSDQCFRGLKQHTRGLSWPGPLLMVLEGCSQGAGQVVSSSGAQVFLQTQSDC